MIAWEAPVEAVAAGVAAAVTLVTLARHGFRHAVQDIVKTSQAELIKRQADFETRQGQHLDRQDQRLERIERKLNQAQRRLRDRLQPVVSTSGSTGGPGGTSYQGSSSGVALVHARTTPGGYVSSSSGTSPQHPGTEPWSIRVCSANVSSPRSFTTSSRMLPAPLSTYPLPA